MDNIEASTSPGPERNAEELSQTELEALRNAVVELEVTTEIFGDVPEGDLTNMDELASPPMFDEKLAPTGLYRATNGNLLRVTVYRNPDSNEVSSASVAVADAERNANGQKIEAHYVLGPDSQDPLKLELTKHTYLLDRHNKASDAETADENAQLEQQSGSSKNRRSDAADLLRALDGAEPINLADLL